MSKDKKLCALVVGKGSAGTRHAENLTHLGVSVITMDTDPEKGADYLSLDEALEKVKADMVVICTPPTSHIALTRKAVRAGCHVLVEKPLSHSMRGVESLVKDARDNDAFIVTAFNLKFEPSLKNLVGLLVKRGDIGRVLNVICEYGHYLPYDYPDYKKRYVSGRGGGVILNAAIHEIDLLMSWFGEVGSVKCIPLKTGTLAIEEEDCADIYLTFKSGLTASIHADYLQHQYHRTIKFIGTDGVIVWDFGNLEVRVRSKSFERWRVFKIPEGVKDAMYLETMRYFVDRVTGKHGFDSSMDGVDALRVALEAKKVGDCIGCFFSYGDDKPQFNQDCFMCMRADEHFDRYMPVYAMLGRFPMLISRYEEESGKKVDREKVKKHIGKEIH